MSKTTHQLLRLSSILLIGLIFSSCSPIIKAAQPSQSELIELGSGQSIGQTFVSRFKGLNGIEIYIQPEDINQGKLFLSLYPSSQEMSKEIAIASIPLGNISHPDNYLFEIPTISDSFNRYYYVQVELEGQGKILLATGPRDSYLNGALYQNGSPLESQLTFSLTYNPIDMVFGVILEILNWLIMVTVGFWLFVIPGYALLSLTYPAWRSLSTSIKLSISAGVSLAIYPIFYLWTDLVGLHLGHYYAWIPPTIGLLIIIWRNKKKFTDLNRSKPPTFRVSNLVSQSTQYLKSPQVRLPDILFLAIVILVISTRFWVIRNLDAPMWGDSYQHTMISQLLVDNKGLFESWIPYADLTTFTYHFGFHTLVSSLHWLTGISMPQAVLWTGQILNAFAVITLYPLAIRVGRNKWVGIIAVIMAGTLLSMPMFYVNWGRYTQLSGLILLTSYAFIAWELLNKDAKRLNIGLLLGIILAGLALTHYRIIILALLFLPVFLVIYGRESGWNSILKNALMSSIVGGLLFLPWFIHVFSGKIIKILSNKLTLSLNAASNVAAQSDNLGNLFEFLPPYVWLLLPIIIGWGLWKREKGIALISLWWYLILLVTNPQWLGLPGAGLITNFTVLIAAYIPASILFGYTGGSLIDRLIPPQPSPNEAQLQFRSRSISIIGITIILLLLATWGARQRLTDIDPSLHALVTRPDIRAGEWIKENALDSERYLVNSFLAFSGTVGVGSDGGWWLPLLAESSNTIPPINYIFEKGTRPDYHQWINSLISEIETKGINHPDVLNEYKERGITKIYLGQQRGGVNHAGPQMLDPEELLSSPYYKPIYHQDQVWIFDILD